MKRDMEVIRAILLAIESDKDSNEIEGYDEDTITYHQWLILDAGLCSGTVHNVMDGKDTNLPSFVDLENITWEGHEFIDAVRDASVWNTIKSDFKESSFDTVKSVAKQLAEGFAKKKVEELIKSDATA